MSALSTTILILTLTFAVTHSKNQVNDQAIRQIVLQKAIVDSTFIFGKWTGKSRKETHLKYLGKVTTKHGQSFKIINSIWFWGIAHRATSRILVFNDHNQYVGNYYMMVTSDLPTNMENGNLLFENSNGNCDKHLETIIDLKKGLPKTFLRKCKEKYGDIYCFDSD